MQASFRLHCYAKTWSRTGPISVLALPPFHCSRLSLDLLLRKPLRSFLPSLSFFALSLFDNSLFLFDSSSFFVLLVRQLCLLRHPARQTAALDLPQQRGHTIRFRENGIRTKGSPLAVSGVECFD